MAALPDSVRERSFEGVLAWAPLLVGLCVMYVPTFADIADRFWHKADESHGPVMLAIVVWLLWRQRACLEGVPTRRERLAGAAALGVGLGLYVVGRSQEFFQFDVGSLVPVVAGVALLTGGRRGLSGYWFPALFTVFLIPVPPSVIDSILVSLKSSVSEVVADSLYALGYPVARSGVVLQVGQYQLLIADACSGLKSMIALAGIGGLYVFLAGHTARWVKVTLLAAALPIAFLANVARVMVLALVTYYCGDDFGRGFHDYAGYLEIALAFGAFFLLDFCLASLPQRAAVAPVGAR